MKVALYARVSTSEQKTENQKLILVEEAKKQGWEYEYFEEKESTRKTRPIKYSIMEKLRSKEFDAVCVLKIDRWARSNLELLNEVEEFKKKNIGFISLREKIDITTSDGMLQFSIFASFANWEREKIRERTLDGLARAKSEGKTLGRPKGKKDSKPRAKSGYYVRWANEKKKKKYSGE
jgi:DNA invertase Pin-like site-specific DNA recombinase